MFCKYFFYDLDTPLFQFQPLTIQSFVPIFCSALGGICVGLTTKYAGSVYKGYALAFGVIISTGIRAQTSNIPPALFLSSILVICSLLGYNYFPFIPSPSSSSPVSRTKPFATVAQFSSESDDIEGVDRTFSDCRSSASAIPSAFLS